MKRLALAAVFLAGCLSPYPKVISGTHISLGAYIPWDGQLYGVELMQYTSGVVVTVPSNQFYEVRRNFSATNDWCWGMLKSVESTYTGVTLNPTNVPGR